MLYNSSQTRFYSEEETIQISRLDPQLIRSLCEDGFIGCHDIVEEQARFNTEDLTLLRRVRRLYNDLGVNLEGIEIILHLRNQLEALQNELEHYQRRER
jgi:MerR family transcriptional regulator/heat shock protein HspR